MKKKEQASKSDVAHFDGLLGIWPSTPPTPSDDLQQLLGSSIFGASVTEAMLVLLDAMLMTRGGDGVASSESTQGWFLSAALTLHM